MNARTWHRLCLSAYTAPLAVVGLMFVPEDSAVHWLAMGVIGWVVLIATMGAWMGILFALGRLELDCPECDSTGRLEAHQAESMVLDCPECGPLGLSVGRFGALQTVDISSPAYQQKLAEEEALQANSPNLLTVCKRHPVVFGIMFLPVIFSIIAGGLLHHLSSILFYLIIPGFFCFFLGSIMLQTWLNGFTRVNNRLITSRKNPIRFYGGLLLLVFAYGFAVYFPVGFALQESGKTPPLHEENQGSSETPP